MVVIVNKRETEYAPTKGEKKPENIKRARTKAELALYSSCDDIPPIELSPRPDTAARSKAPQRCRAVGETALVAYLPKRDQTHRGSPPHPTDRVFVLGLLTNLSI